MSDMTIKRNDEFSFTIELKRKDKKVWAKILMMPKYAATEWMFPKKEKAWHDAKAKKGAENK